MWHSALTMRVPPQRWSREIGIWAALFILLLWPALLWLGVVGVLLLAAVLFTAANVTNAIKVTRRRNPDERHEPGPPYGRR